MPTEGRAHQPLPTAPGQPHKAPGPADRHGPQATRRTGHGGIESPHAASRIGPGALHSWAPLSRRCCWPVGVGFYAGLPIASPSSSLTRTQEWSPLLSSSALRARDALVLEHLPLADAIAAARRLFLLVEPEDLIHVARGCPGLSRRARQCPLGATGADPAGAERRGARRHAPRSRPARLHIADHDPGGLSGGHVPAAPAAAVTGGDALLRDR